MLYRQIPAVAAFALFCFAGPAAAQTPEPPPRQYAPDRAVDFEHLKLDLTPDFARRTLTAEATLQFHTLRRPVGTLRLDAVDLRVTNVTASVALADWEVTDDAVLIHFAQPLPPETPGWVRLGYWAEPERGLYFRTAAMGYPEGEDHLWTQGQAVSSRHWFPAFDWPNDKLTSEVTCRVPEGMVVLSNGRKTGEVKTNGLVAVTWLQDQPHANYLITLVAGPFRALEDRHGEIPLGFWTLPSDFPNAASSFEGTRDMMDFFEEFTGVPYPWPIYNQVCVADFVAGGMENTTLTVLRNTTLFPPGFEELRSSQGLVAHELAHQWFGDLVTCKDWSNLWLNEGFATYGEHLYREHKQGRDDFRHRLHESRRGLVESATDTRPMVWRGYRSTEEMFDHRAYGRGAWVLHMLRSELGDVVFRQGVRLFLDRHAYGSVVTSDFVAAMEEVSGRSLDRFFDQWVYHGGRPEIEVDYSWDENLKLARIGVRQTQAINEQVLRFHFPLKVRFAGPEFGYDRELDVTQVAEDFFIPLPRRPEIVRVDPDVALMAKINFRPPAAMLAAQIADPNDPIGRVQAAEQLAGRRDQEAVSLLQTRLAEDPFYGVRIAAAKSLRAIHSDAALAALLAAPRQEDARVRLQVVEAIGGFTRDSARDALLRVAREEKNPDIQAATIRALGAWPTPEIREQLVLLLRSESYEEVLARAAFQSLRRLDDPATAGAAFAALREREWPRGTLGTAMDAVAWLARGQEDRTGVREFLVSQTASPRRGTRVSAINALGTLEDPRALPVLESFAGSARENQERRAAERAIAAIRGAGKLPTELGTLRDEVLDLKQQNRELKASVEQLRRKLEALAPPTPARPPARPARR